MMNSRKTPLARLLLVVFIGSVGMLLARAQEPTKPPEQRQNDKDSAHQFHPGREIAHETREAAGEEAENDQTGTFKHSPSVQKIAKWTGLSVPQAYWFSDILNFAVIAGIVFWAAKKSLPALFRDRTAAIQKAMQEAQKASEEARQKLAEIESRLQRLDSEIAAMRAAAESEGAAEEVRIKAAAQEDAHKIVAAAEQEIAAAAKAARRRLTAHAADLAVSLAQKQIRVDASTDQALVRNFAGQLATDKAGKDGH